MCNSCHFLRPFDDLRLAKYWFLSFRQCYIPILDARIPEGFSMDLELLSSDLPRIS